MTDDLAAHIDNELTRLGHSSFTGADPGFRATPEPGSTTRICMGHPTKRFEVALYDGPTLLAALQPLATGTPWPIIQAALLGALIA